MRIRVARPDEVDLLVEIERDSDALFAEVGITFPDAGEDHRTPFEDAETWVAVGADDVPLAFARLDSVDGTTHVEQLAVRRSAQRRGIGAMLLDHVGAGRALTLTTYREVPWNGPYYERLGFRELAPSEVTPGLARILEQEHEVELDRHGTRIAMRREPRR